MKKYQEITRARKLLGLPERATMKEIKDAYRVLVSRWHPDRCGGGPESAEMTRKLIASYRTLMDYCENYEYSFSEEEVKKNLSPQEWWMEHFGEDPIWGGNSGSK